MLQLHQLKHRTVDILIHKGPKLASGKEMFMGNEQVINNTLQLTYHFT